MFNVLNKSLFCILVISAVLSCSKKEDTDAANLYNLAQESYEKGEYLKAINLLDSLDKHYQSQTELRRKGMHLRPQVEEKIFVQQLQTVDSIITFTTEEFQNLKQSLDTIDDGFEGFYTTKKLSDKFPPSKEGLYTKVTKDGKIFIITAAKKGTGSSAIKLTAGNEEITSPIVPYDGELNNRDGNFENIIFMSPANLELLEFVNRNNGEQISVTFIGNKSYDIKLDDTQAEAMSQLYKAYNSSEVLHKAYDKKQELEKRIQIARSQMARTFQEKH